ncbi:MAG: DUF3098 domain-containing protein [Crocinitomicaceae bacterium]|nr:DUF3098 domain-containing protein [Crocinitomicaceae bacterium]
MSANNSNTNEMSSTDKRLNKESVSLKEFNKTAPFSFSAKNYKLLLIGLGINILGFILMIGGATEDPNEFDASELFSHTRITVAPMLIVVGYIVIAYAIMKRPQSDSK